MRAQRLEILAPSAWTFRLLTSDSSEPFLKATGWAVEVQKGTQPRRQGESSMHKIVLDVHSVTRALDRWIPLAFLSNGTVRVPGFGFDISEAVWSNASLRALVASNSLAGTAAVQFAISPGQVTRFDILSDALEVRMDGSVSTNASGLVLKTAGDWLSNRFDLQADFGRTSLLPRTGTLRVPGFRLPGTSLGAANYPDVFGTLSADWQEGEFALDLAAGTTFLSPTSPPPVRLTLKARGDTNSAVIHSALLDSPWLTAELSRDLEVNFTGRLLQQPGFLRIASDLSRQRWLPVTGLLEGEATLAPAGKFPDILFRVSGTDMGTAHLKPKTFDAAGIFNWPLLNLTALSAAFEDNSHVEATGIVNLQSKTVTNGQVLLTGGLANRWLPEGTKYETLNATANLSGFLTNLAHRGALVVTNFITAALQPLTAHATWTGQGHRTFTARIATESRSSKVELEGIVETAPDGISLLLNGLTLKTNHQQLLELAAPARVTLARQGTNTAVEAEPFQLQGPAGDLKAHGKVLWPITGSVTVAARGLRTGIISDFVQGSLPEIDLTRLTLAAAWTNGPVVGVADLLASGFVPLQATATNAQPRVRAHPEGYPITVQLNLEAQSDRVTISNLVVTTERSNVISASGVLPVRVAVSHPGMIEVLTNGPVQLAASAKPDAVLWKELAERTKLKLNNPNLNVDVSGTWTAPSGKVRLTADQVLLPQPGPATPTLNGLALNADLRPDRARADLQLLVQGLPVNATAELPLDKEFWSSVNRKEMPSLEKATARLRIEDSSLALVAGLYPTLLSPQGDIAADVTMLPGGQLKGQIAVEKARTRPFPGIGPLREINAGINLLGESANPTASALVGGSQVHVGGSVSLSGNEWLQGQLPPFKLTVLGTNVPLSRKPESIIRSDINLTVQKTNDAPPLITGTARLRNSFYLSDVRALLPSGGGSAPSRRPPYFSIEQPFLADWRLRVQVTGDRFLKVRSTLFNGEISGNLQLQGTLKDPMALGDMRITSGSIRFPFSSLRVQQGFVTLGSQDPYRPQLSLHATARQFGYDIRMDASGPADQPLLQFSSTPPLTSEQIVLMITAGQVPRDQQVYSTVQRAQTFALFLGRDLLAQLGLADNAQDRLTFRSGERISETGRPTYNIEYELTPTWSVTGEYDRFNEFNVGLRWRVYSK